MSRKASTTRPRGSDESRIVVHLDDEAHKALVKVATDSDRTIAGQARYLIKKGLGLTK